MKVLNIYTDGGFHPNTKVGAYAFVIVDGNDRDIIKEFSKAEKANGDNKVTNNTMELNGVIKALNWVKSNGYNPNDYRIYLHTDSQYVQLGIDEWLEGWKRKNWKNSANQPVKNKDLWMKLDNLVSFSFRSIHIQWVKGHNGNTFNDIADKLCTKAIEEYEISL